ncbi:MAG: hypothetical protein U0575_14805 [Phycisphaerales bacterium]
MGAGASDHPLLMLGSGNRTRWSRWSVLAEPTAGSSSMPTNRSRPRR